MGSALLESRQTGLDYDVTNLGAVAFNPTIAAVEDADVILLVGTNLRWEAPLVNTRVRKAIKKGARVFAIGPEVDLTYRADWLGNDLGLLGKLPDRAAEALDAAQRPLVIVDRARWPRVMARRWRSPRQAIWSVRAGTASA